MVWRWFCTSARRLSSSSLIARDGESGDEDDAPDGAAFTGDELPEGDTIDGVPTRGRDVNHSFSETSCAGRLAPSLTRVFNRFYSQSTRNSMLTGPPRQS